MGDLKKWINAIIKDISENNELNPKIKKELISVLKEEAAKFQERLNFGKKTFKIDGTWWKTPTEGKFAWKLVKVNPAWDVTQDLKTWEQVFIDYDKFLDHMATNIWCTPQEFEAKHLITKKDFLEKMGDKPSDSAEYKAFYDDEGFENSLAGYWSSDDNKFHGIGKRCNVWLAGGDNVGFNKDWWDLDNNNKSSGFSGCLLKK